MQPIPEDKALPSVQYETVKLDVVFVEEKVVCRAVSLVVTVDLKVMQPILKEKKHIIENTLLEKERAMSIGCTVTNTVI